MLYKDDPHKLARIMDKLLDREVHQLTKSAIPFTYYSANPPVRSHYNLPTARPPLRKDDHLPSLNPTEHLLNMESAASAMSQFLFHDCYLITLIIKFSINTQLFVRYNRIQIVKNSF